MNSYWCIKFVVCVRLLYGLNHTNVPLNLQILFHELLSLIVLGIEIGMKESLEKLKGIIGQLRLKEGISH